MDNVNECVIEWIKGENVAHITMPNHTRLKSRIVELADKHEDVEYITNEDGSIYASLPTSWIRINPSREISEEEKVRRTEILRTKAREKLNKT